MTEPSCTRARFKSASTQADASPSTSSAITSAVADSLGATVDLDVATGALFLALLFAALDGAAVLVGAAGALLDGGLLDGAADALLDGGLLDGVEGFPPGEQRGDRMAGFARPPDIIDGETPSVDSRNIALRRHATAEQRALGQSVARAYIIILGAGLPRCVVLCACVACVWPTWLSVITVFSAAA